jgi:ribosome-associated translation inhibitor RaiA
MKTTLQFLSLTVHNSWYRLLEQHLDRWQRLTAITATDVVVERQREGGPTFHVQVLLKVAGPDLHTEASGRTLKAALMGATQDLECQIQDRQMQRLQRRARERQLGAAAAPQVYA